MSMKKTARTLVAGLIVGAVRHSVASRERRYLGGAGQAASPFLVPNSVPTRSPTSSSMFSEGIGSVGQPTGLNQASGLDSSEDFINPHARAMRLTTTRWAWCPPR